MDDEHKSIGSEEQKKPYAKPQVQQVPLRPDEAVLGGCKTSSKSGPSQFRCTSPKSCSSATS